MATPKKTVAKASKKTVAPKKAAPAKKTKAVKPVAKKAAPAKKTAPAKAAKKVEVAKKKVATNSKATSKTTKTVATKKTVKAPVKKATPKKAVAKAPAKKLVKPAAPVKKAPAKPAAKAPAKKAAPPKAAPKKVAAPKEAVKKTASKSSKKAPAKKIIKTVTQNATIAPSRPLPSSVNRVVREEKKPNVIVAHRKLENKSKKALEDEKTISTDYQPQYVSILDEPVQETTPTKRYSDEDLAEFKELILGRMEAARKELAYLQGLITRKDEAGTEDTENRYMNMEDGSGAMEREQLAQMASRQIQFIGHLEKALVRIESKTYGVCRVTGKLIDKARLRAVPHATLSIEAKKEMTKN